MISFKLYFSFWIGADEVEYVTSLAVEAAFILFWTEFLILSYCNIIVWLKKRAIKFSFMPKI